MKKPAIIKGNKRIQRADIELTQSVAGALVKKIFSGETLFPKEGHLLLAVEDDSGKEITVKLRSNTLHTWIKRNNVLPTGKVLRELLDEARAEHRTRKEKEMDQERRALIDRKLNRVISMRTKEPVVGMFGAVKNADGSIMEKENSRLLRIQMDTAKWLAERLMPERYGKVEKPQNNVFIFSLSELRKAKERQQNETVLEMQEESQN